MLRTIVFDMGNVLVHFSHEQMCQQIGSLFDQPAAVVRTRLFESGLQDRFEKGHIPPEEFQAELEQTWGRPVAGEDLKLAAADIFRLNEPLLPVIEALRNAGYRLVVLSNTHVWHFEHVWERYPILQRFDDWVTSYQAGAMKPDPAIFHALDNVLECAPSEAFYTDDIPAYIDAGRRHGLNAALFTDVPALCTALREHGVDFPEMPGG
jgi:HAD superfamily hydrolase (TIGR01509 family)